MKITGVDLAAALNVDPSLVSRWLKGTRKLDPKSELYSKLLLYVLDCDIQVNYQNVATLVNDFMKPGTNPSRQILYDCLDKWIVSNSANSKIIDNDSKTGNYSISTFSVCTGTKKQKIEMLSLLTSALELKHPSRIDIFFDKRTNLLLDEKDFYEQWINLLDILLQQGYEINFIYSTMSSTSFINAFDHFLRLCSYDTFHAFILPKSSKIGVYNLFILENTKVITDFTPLGENDSLKLFCFTQQDIVDRMEIIYNNIISSCLPLTSINSYLIFRLRNVLSIYPDKLRDIIIYTGHPFIFPINEKVLADILSTNGLDNLKINNTIEKYNFLMETIFNYTGNSPIRILLNVDELLSLLILDSIDFRFNFLYNNNIKIYKKYYKYFLESLVNILSSNKKSIDICFVDGVNLIQNSNLFVFDINGIYAEIQLLRKTSNNMKRELLNTTDITLTEDIYNYMDDLYQHSADENHNKDNMLRILNVVLNKLS